MYIQYEKPRKITWLTPVQVRHNDRKRSGTYLKCSIPTTDPKCFVQIPVCVRKAQFVTMTTPTPTPTPTPSTPTSSEIIEVIHAYYQQRDNPTNVKESYGDHPFHTICNAHTEHSPELVRILLETFGPQRLASWRDRLGNTPLQYAMAYSEILDGNDSDSESDEDEDDNDDESGDNNNNDDESGDDFRYMSELEKRLARPSQLEIIRLLLEAFPIASILPHSITGFESFDIVCEMWHSREDVYLDVRICDPIVELTDHVLRARYKIRQELGEQMYGEISTKNMPYNVINALRDENNDPLGTINSLRRFYMATRFMDPRDDDLQEAMNNYLFKLSFYEQEEDMVRYAKLIKTLPDLFCPITQHQKHNHISHGVIRYLCNLYDPVVLFDKRDECGRKTIHYAFCTKSMVFPNNALSIDHLTKIQMLLEVNPALLVEKDLFRTSAMDVMNTILNNKTQCKSRQDEVEYLKDIVMAALDNISMTISPFTSTRKHDLKASSLNDLYSASSHDQQRKCRRIGPLCFGTVLN